MLAIGDYFTTEQLPKFKKIDRYILRKEKATEVFKGLQGKRIFVMCGQDDHIPEEEICLIEEISKKIQYCFWHRQAF